MATFAIIECNWIKDFCKLTETASILCTPWSCWFSSWMASIMIFTMGKGLFYNSERGSTVAYLLTYRSTLIIGPPHFLGHCFQKKVQGSWSINLGCDYNSTPNSKKPSQIEGLMYISINAVVAQMNVSQWLWSGHSQVVCSRIAAIFPDLANFGN